MGVETGYKHVALDADGVAVVGGTAMKVAQLVVEQHAYGWSPEELHFQHPELSIGQIHGALAYYWDHAAELNEAIRERLARIEQLRDELVDANSPLRRRLAASGHAS